MLTEGMYLSDRYEIVGKIGAGGMSDVYKAKDHILGRFVAIKVLKQEYSEDRNFVTKFRTEAQSAAGLEHPNIVNIYDVGSEEGMYFIVMEYVEGITLKTYIEKKGQLSFKESVSIAIQVARGIEAAHNKHIIHRDIKPQNIIISTEGKVKVTDFGIARAASANTISSDVMGSVHYASPEQARNGFVDARSDIYSLGIVMYEMVTGRVPFDGDTTVAVAIQHLQEDMPDPMLYAEDLPISLDKIILKCAQKNVDRRYQTIGELLTDLRKALINPNEDFVVENQTPDTGKTKVISGEELQQIKEKGTGVRAESGESGDDEELMVEDLDEDDDESGMNPKMDKAITVMCIVVAVIIVIVILYLLGSFFGLFRFGKSRDHKNTESEYVSETQSESESESETETEEMVKMINIVGMTEEEAEEALDKIGLSLFVVDMKESEEEDGTILEQEVEKGEEVAKGSTIDVVVAGDSSVTEMVPVPNVLGSSESSAISKLRNNGLSYEKEYEYSSEVAAGNVISQNPSGGSSVKKNTTVKITISQGVKSVKVPKVTGYSEADASSMLSNAGLNVTVDRVYDDSTAEGRVISQSISDGKTVEEGTTVTITVSLGKKTVYYSCSYTLDIPADVTKADIVLQDSDGNVITSWNQQQVDPGTTFNVSKSNITGSSSGKILVTWYRTNDAGETEEVSRDTFSVNFTEQ